MNVDAAVFDVFGTLTDWRSSVAAELAEVGERTGLHADWTAVAEDWRRRYRPTLGRVVAGDLPWGPLDALHRLMLDEVLTRHGLDALSDADRDHLVRAWHRLRAWPDVPEGLERLQRSPVLTATLSNGGVGLLTRLAKQAGLRFDCILSAELARSYKPDPRVYRKAAELLDVEPSRLLMVACHPDDLEAAAAVSLRTAYVPRPEWGPEAAPVPPPAEADLVATDLNDLARTLAETRG
ncbi:haloacid dehalogenase type II [Actinomadura madurae]|uniref:haloacid dehalogenase type II n=1 Tax=Actinomadura madurae TaxID=1993 RepID=UPI0020D258F0|nr:haloacid dehalogenase type II [Actinomadura madurae]MCP9955943.1 haloacid dehalogenase type II [Actinomadura madurae]MCP9972626.1 haloacid dehalogenase type II [Actinomadura madurae]